MIKSNERKPKASKSRIAPRENKKMDKKRENEKQIKLKTAHQPTNQPTSKWVLICISATAVSPMHKYIADASKQMRQHLTHRHI